MSTGALLVAMAATQAVTSVSQGYAQSAEDKYNATIAGLQGQAAGIQGQITQGQLTRKGGELASNQMATVGASGVMPTGSYAAAMLDTQTQINTDKAIAQYNTTMQINYAQAKSDMLKQQAKTAQRQGYEAAFSTVLRGAASYYAYSGGGDTIVGAGTQPGQTGYGALRY